ncbi:MAG: group 1 glycosyl transferase [Candidatus Saganbacteria bacterium]|uniref:Group 1 glycosyl transferase n=1 Tax=Candidatus Saganbacteria bacterium TaxID=2575572 RepID=A0A833L214_UNCSA|nr:MAG: group 1 glycosyl transferase [Candidatus Saganbacteria bacterium]
MRIAFFCDSYKPYLSGVTNSIEILVKELRELGHRVYIFAPRYPGYVDFDPDIIRFPSLPTGYPNFRLALPYLIRIPEVDLIHSHSPFQTGLIARYLAHRRRVPFIYTFHTLFTRYVHYAQFIPEPLSKLALSQYIVTFCRRTDLIIAPSKMAKRVLKSWTVRNRIEIVPTGVDLSHIKEANKFQLRKKYNIPQDAKVLVYVGRLSKEKNLSFLLHSFKKLNKLSYLAIVGAGPMENEIKKAKIPNLIMVGEVKYPEILSYYSIGDIFVFSSTTETQGLVLAEAKAAGLPAVALFAGGLVDTVRSGIDGYLTTKEGFVEHIKLLLTDEKLREKMGKAAREDIINRFSSTAIAKKVECLYNEALNKGA